MSPCLLSLRFLVERIIYIRIKVIDRYQYIRIMRAGGMYESNSRLFAKSDYLKRNIPTISRIYYARGKNPI